MDPTFGPFEKWLSDDTRRSARVRCRRGEWRVSCFFNLNNREDPLCGLGYGATLAEACANAMNDIMVRRGDL